MIIKVQISQASSDEEKHMLIYNKDRKFEYEGLATKEVLTLMKDEPKLFFKAKIVDTKFIIEDYAKFQDW